jgi:hypothetical protein
MADIYTKRPAGLVRRGSLTFYNGKQVKIDHISGLGWSVSEWSPGSGYGNELFIVEQNPFPRRKVMPKRKKKGARRRKSPARRKTPRRKAKRKTKRKTKRARRKSPRRRRKVARRRKAAPRKVKRRTKVRSKVVTPFGEF